MTTCLTGGTPFRGTIRVCPDTAAHHCHRIGSASALVCCAATEASVTSASDPEPTLLTTSSQRSEAAPTTRRIWPLSTTAPHHTAIARRPLAKPTRHAGDPKARIQGYATDGPDLSRPHRRVRLDAAVHLALRRDVPRVVVGEAPSHVRHGERGRSTSLCVRVSADRIRAKATR